jgi:hypothetical protein
MLLDTIISEIAFVIWVWLQVYCIALEFRFLSIWFLTINPYEQPFLTLWELTNAGFLFGKILYPKLFGIDITVFVNFKVLQYLINLFEKIAFK